MSNCLENNIPIMWNEIMQWSVAKLQGKKFAE
jgi:hypothetical protein